MEVVIIIGIIIFLIWVFNGSHDSSPTKTTVTEAEYQRRARLQRETSERQTAIDRQSQLERDRQASERQRLNQKIATFKTNWQDFQIVLQQNGITKLYHFTDRSNLPSIRATGGLYSWHYCQENNITIPRPGGSPTSWILDQKKGLQNFVRVSFVREHPMLYIAQKDGRIISPVVLEISIEQIYKSSTRYATQNAARNGVTADATFEKFNSIRFPLLKRRYFDLSVDERPFYQAEILVLEKIPLEYITNINSV